MTHSALHVHTLLCLLIGTVLATSCAAQDNYFQQQVHYDIDVALDDTTHTLHSHLRLTYTNHAPHGLDSIVFHLWPRAYSSDNTAFARQQLRNGSTRFHFAEEDERGTMDSLDFRVDGQPARFRFTEEADIGVLYLARPLVPGETVTVTTPFRVKLPRSFSRLGHVGQSYQVTQWYPKPAVYDRDGWHAMPYLDRGEFYSEFGSFRVSITLPENYQVAATGMLQEEEERQWLLTKVDSTRRWLDTATLADGYVRQAFPPSAARSKTLTYTAEDVHDFAWFADKRFHVLFDTVTVDTPITVGTPIDVWSFFTQSEAALWQHSTDYLKRAVRFYSNIDSYPYPQMTGVQSALSAGAGMEYPMITVIGLSRTDFALDQVLTHEVGHNWFYGVLGSNERAHAWMDEGLNSYYEERYTRRYYPERPTGTQLIPGRRVDLNLLGQRYLARLGRSQPPATPADSFATMNYWEASYGKPALALQALEERYGATALDSAFAAYYAAWKFRHPGPEDFLAAMEARLPGAGGYLREAMYTTDRGDFNHEVLTPERDGPLRLRFLTAQEKPGTQLFYVPLVFYNAHDGVLAGLALHNRTLEPRPLEWIVAPMYGFGGGGLAGFAGARYRWRQPFAGVQRLELAGGLRRFNYFTPDGERFAGLDLRYNYLRTAARFSLIFDHPPITERHSELYLRALRTDEQRPDFDPEGKLLGDPSRLTSHYLIAGYERARESVLDPRAYSLRLEYRLGAATQQFDTDHLRLEATYRGGYQYRQDRFLWWRLFGGYFLANELRDRATYPSTALSLVDNADSDYRYDGLFVGRNENGGYEQQLEPRQGGFRAPVSSAFTWGRSNDYLAALNLDADLPFPLPVGVYCDVGAYGFRPTSSEAATTELNYVGGLSVNMLGRRLRLFVPLLTDPTTRDLLAQRGNIFERLTIELSLSELMPWRWLDELP